VSVDNLSASANIIVTVSFTAVYAVLLVPDDGTRVISPLVSSLRLSAPELEHHPRCAEAHVHTHESIVGTSAAAVKSTISARLQNVGVDKVTADRNADAISHRTTPAHSTTGFFESVWAGIKSVGRTIVNTLNDPGFRSAASWVEGRVRGGGYSQPPPPSNQPRIAQRDARQISGASAFRATRAQVEEVD
jgi:hypothetical protein